jgi:hypothetical protein
MSKHTVLTQNHLMGFIAETRWIVNEQDKYRFQNRQQMFFTVSIQA